MVTTPQTEASRPLQQFRLLHGRNLRWRQHRREDRLEQYPASCRVCVELRGGSATTVLRGGYGIYHDVSAMGGSTGPYQNPPYANAYSFTSDNITPVRTLATGFPDNSQPVDPVNYRGDWTTIDPNFKQGRVQQWSINVEREAIGPHHRECGVRRQLRRPPVRQEP